MSNGDVVNVWRFWLWSHCVGWLFVENALIEMLWSF